MRACGGSCGESAKRLLVCGELRACGCGVDKSPRCVWAVMFCHSCAIARATLVLPAQVLTLPALEEGGRREGVQW